MNINNLVDGLQSGLDTVTKLAPLASKIGLGPLATMAGALAEVANNTIERIQEGAIVATERQASVIRAISADLAKQNDALAAAIAKS